MEINAQYSDQELIEKVLAGDAALFELIIRRNNPFLYRIGKMYHYSHEETQDLMQDSYIQAYMHLAQFQNKSSFKTWISKIMINECYRKSKKWRYTHMESLEDHPLKYKMSASLETSHTIMNTELNSIIEKGLLQIPEDYRSVFTMREINGFSVSETAQILAITESNVKVRLNRAKILLRKEIEKYYNKEEIFEFNLIYCDEMVRRVMNKIALL